MRPTGISRPHPVLTVEVTTFDLEFIRKALALAWREGDSVDKTTFQRIEDDVRKALVWAESR